MKHELIGVIRKTTQLHAIINIIPTQSQNKFAADFGGYLKIKLQGSIGIGGAFTDTKILTDVDDCVLMDSNENILTVTEGSNAWLTITES